MENYFLKFDLHIEIILFSSKFDVNLQAVLKIVSTHYPW